MEQFFPTLKTISKTIDPAVDTEFTFKNERPYFIIDLQAPEVSTAKMARVARANMTCYERAIAKFFSGNFQYNPSEQWPSEPRTIKFLDDLTGVIDPDGKYLLNVVIIEW
jgi:hypothetical protein